MQVIYSERHRQHKTTLQLPGLGVPFHEVPERAEAILAGLAAAGMDDVHKPREFGVDPLLAVHADELIDYLQHAYERSRPFFLAHAPALAETFRPPGARHVPAGYPGLTGYFAFDISSPILEGTWEAAYWSAQCALTAAEQVRNGARAAYALCRPPGHHAARDMHGGFCYLNNAAIAARWLQADAQPVAILDIDYHHGNGTQEIFYADPSVLFCSIHADPDFDYPYFWGGKSETGSGAGEGYNLNWPLLPASSEATFLAALDEALAVIRAVKPSHLVLSAGFDFLEGDPVPRGGFCVTRAGLRDAARRIADLALPTVIVQEGGYAVEHLGDYAVDLLSLFAD